MSVLARFVTNKSGNVAMMFGLAIVPIFGVVGAALDYARVTDVRQELTASLDSAVLAAGAESGLNGKMSDEALQTFVFNWVNSHMSDKKFAGTWQLDSVTQDGDVILAKASGKVDTTLTRVLGFEEMPIGVTSEAVKSVGKVELALVLDNTGSMKGTKIANLKTAAEDLVDTLAAAAKNPADLRIAVVPFSQTVNVGSTYEAAAWLDVAGKSSVAKDQFLGQTVNRINLFKKIGATWGGCVETRSNDFEAADDLPDATEPETLYVPYFAPDEPGNKNAKTYNNSYLKDSKVADIKASLASLGLNDALTLPDYRLLQGDILKYTGTPQTGTTGALGYKYGPNSGCEIAPLSRLSADTGEVKKAIQKMIAAGNTDIPIGATWGRNVLAPDGPFGDGAPYFDKEWAKYAVIMTDGNNENNEGNSEDLSYYSGVGYVWQGRMGAVNGNKASRTAARDTRLGEICKAMKDDGITVYTIRVEVKTGSSKVLEDCASDIGKFYEVQNVANLSAVFADIGDYITSLRLAK
jgi:Flp pilus assembly protein TadG